MVSVSGRTPRRPYRGQNHTFIYSPRKGTPAAEMEDPMSKEEKSAKRLEIE